MKMEICMEMKTFSSSRYTLDTTFRTENNPVFTASTFQIQVLLVSSFFTYLF